MTHVSQEGLAACPFCGDPMKSVEYPGGLYAEHLKDVKCPLVDNNVSIPIAAWNLRLHEHKADGGGREGQNNGPAATREQHMGIGDDAESGAVPVRDNKATPEKDGSIPSGSATPPTREGVIEECIKEVEAEHLDDPVPDSKGDAAYDRAVDDCANALRALLPNPTKEALPEEPKPGWVWVPVEPTEGMLRAAQDSRGLDGILLNDIDVWKAMLRALKEKG